MRGKRGGDAKRCAREMRRGHEQRVDQAGIAPHTSTHTQVTHTARPPRRCDTVRDTRVVCVCVCVCVTRMRAVRACLILRS